MKLIKQLAVVLAAVSLFAVSVNAQTTNRDEKGNIVRGAYETGNFGDHWFIGLGSGINTGFTTKTKPGIGLASEIFVGKWFTPSIGARMSLSGLTLRTHDNTKCCVTEKGGQFWYFGYSADFLWNVSNAISGYKESRIWDVILYTRFQRAFTSVRNAPSHKFTENAKQNFNSLSKDAFTNSYTKDNEFAAGFGMIHNFRLCKRVDLFLDVNALVSKHSFMRVKPIEDEFKAKAPVIDLNRYALLTRAMLGLSFNLGKTEFRRVVDLIPVVEPLPFTVEEYNSLKDRVAQLEEENASLRAKVDSLEKIKPETVYVEKTSECPPTVTLYFNIDKAWLTKRELAHLEYFMATRCKDLPFTLIGSADKETASAKYNQRLSERRCEYVKKLLVEVYGISAEQITTVAEGDTNNVFNTPAKNRVVTIK